MRSSNAVLTYTLVFVLAACAAVHTAAADNPAGLADTLTQHWKDKLITLRVSDPSGHLIFNSHGERVGTGKPGNWAIDSTLRVESVVVNGRELRIEGRRVAIYFDPKQGTFLRSGTNSKVRIDVELADSNAVSRELTPALGNIFMRPSEQLGEIAPEYWKNCFSGKIIREKRRWVCHDSETESTPVIGPLPNSEAKDSPESPKLYKVGGGVTPPKALYTPDPSYTQIAKKAAFQGTTILWLIVDSDGKPKKIRVVSPLGLGLDDEAVRAVERWRFQPSTKDGHPVAVQINVEVNFRLY